MSGSLGLDGFAVFISFRMWRSRSPREHIVRRSPWPSCAGRPSRAGVGVLEGSAGQTQDLPDLSCMSKSNHAATTLGYYFSTGSRAGIAFCSSESLGCHRKCFTRLHRISQVIISLCCLNRNVYCKIKGLTVFNPRTVVTCVLRWSCMVRAAGAGVEMCCGKRSPGNFRYCLFLLW